MAGPIALSAIYLIVSAVLLILLRYSRCGSSVYYISDCAPLAPQPSVAIFIRRSHLVCRVSRARYFTGVGRDDGHPDQAQPVARRPAIGRLNCLFALSISLPNRNVYLIR
jgi:hypothetical protein